MAKTRYWVKIDSKGKPVLGVLEARSTRPKNGEWLEINARPCCSVTALIGDPGASTDTIITLTCGGTTLLEFTDAGVVDPATVAADFNIAHPAVGTMTQDGVNFILTSSICPSLEMTVTYA